MTSSWLLTALIKSYTWMGWGYQMQLRLSQVIRELSEENPGNSSVIYKFHLVRGVGRQDSILPALPFFLTPFIFEKSLQTGPFVNCSACLEHHGHASSCQVLSDENKFARIPVISQLFSNYLYCPNPLPAAQGLISNEKRLSSGEVYIGLYITNI